MANVEFTVRGDSEDGDLQVGDIYLGWQPRETAEHLAKVLNSTLIVKHAEAYVPKNPRRENG